MIDTTGFIEQLKARLDQPLPAWEAHKIMAPPSRLPSPDYSEKKKQARLGCVLALLYPADGTLYTVLTQRPEYEGTHSGQISFPGGKVEEYDTDYVATALREAREEVNIQAEEVTVLGQLSELYIPPSNFLVFPVVGYATQRPNFIPDEREVVDIIELPLEELLKAENIGTTSIVANKIFRFDSPTFIFNGKIVWGATAMMLAELKYLMEEIYRGESSEERGV
jgi:8-oxo-dGTP pyrophosphatase MutT (NUDIX family)